MDRKISWLPYVNYENNKKLINTPRKLSAIWYESICYARVHV